MTKMENPRDTREDLEEKDKENEIFDSYPYDKPLDFDTPRVRPAMPDDLLDGRFDRWFIE